MSFAKTRLTQLPPYSCKKNEGTNSVTNSVTKQNKEEVI